MAPEWGARLRALSPRVRGSGCFSRVPWLTPWATVFRPPGSRQRPGRAKVGSREAERWDAEAGSRKRGQPEAGSGDSLTRPGSLYVQIFNYLAKSAWLFTPDRAVSAVSGLEMAFYPRFSGFLCRFCCIFLVENPAGTGQAVPFGPSAGSGCPLRLGQAVPFGWVRLSPSAKRRNVLQDPPGARVAFGDSHGLRHGLQSFALRAPCRGRVGRR